jgi:ubiquinol-cytochrome c reductase iron-sulfur subunit
MTSRAEKRAAAFFVASGLSGAALIVAYILGATTQVLGGLLAAAMAGLCFGLVTWANRLMPQGPFEEARQSMSSGDTSVENAKETARGGSVAFARRSLLGKTLGFALAATGLAALTPLRSLGPSPGRKLAHTPWQPDRRAVGEDGVLVRATEIPVGGIVTIFPEGFAGSADGQVVLIHLEPGMLRPGEEGADGAHGDFIAYSRVCTHAGCPVALYSADDHQLLCPCHQSAFDVLRGAKPVFGPAAAALPQLPITVDEDGVVRARSDFTEPVGPAYWGRR